MSDVDAEHAQEALMHPTDPWGTLGAHVVAAKGARGARVGGGVSVRSFTLISTGGKHQTPQLRTQKYYPLQTGSWSRPGTPTPS